jgi:hypothetical protein
MEQTFKKYLKQARQDFAKVVSKYTVTEHLELRTAIDSLLIAYGQATDKAINFTDSSLQFNATYKKGDIVLIDNKEEKTVIEEFKNGMVEVQSKTGWTLIGKGRLSLKTKSV